MNLTKDIKLKELDINELEDIQGGAWLADIVEKVLCGCSEYVGYPTGGAAGMRYF
tara:strand:- start:2867 stop:3031 length:165 start_codon:yes stop_codon:yes gene_type:complete